MFKDMLNVYTIFEGTICLKQIDIKLKIKMKMAKKIAPMHKFCACYIDTAYSRYTQYFVYIDRKIVCGNW